MIFENTRECSDEICTFPFDGVYGYIYYLLWEDDEVLYVGQSTNVFTRIGTHLSNGIIPFFKFRYFQVDPDEMNDLEAQEIIKYKPRYNNSLPQNDCFFTLDQMKSRYQIMRGKDIKIHRIIDDLEIKSHWGYISVSDWADVHKILEGKDLGYKDS